MRAAATLATTPSEANGASDGHKRPRHVSASSTSSSRLVPHSQLYPVTRTPSAPFPVTRTPSAQGLAMIQTTEASPPPTNISFEDAVRILHATERRLRSEVQLDIMDLRLHMTAPKIERVTFKASRLHALRTLVNNCRVLCRQEEDVMRDFGRIKERLSNIRGDIDEDGYEDTKTECLVYGGKLTDIKRRQRRLAGHAEVMREELSSVMAPEDIASAGEDEESFDVERFKRESSQQPLLSLTPTPLTSYPLFNSAPYSSGPSGDKLNQQLKSSTSSPIPTFQTKDNRNITDNDSIGKTVASTKTTIPRGSKLLIEDAAARGSYPTTEDEQEEAYFPTSRKKRTTGLHRRPKTTSMSSAVSSDTDGEEYNWTNDTKILQANATLIEEKLKRKEQQDDNLENGRQTIVTTEYTMKDKKEREIGILDQNTMTDNQNSKLGVEKLLTDGIKEEQIEATSDVQLKAAEQESMAKIKAEEEAKKKLVAEKKKADIEAKKKAIEEKRLEVEAKKKEEEEAKKKIAAEKKKADMEAKKKATEEKKKLEAEAKKKEDEEKQKAEDERKKKAEAVKKRLEEKQAQAKKLEEEKKKAEEEKKKLEELKKAEMQAKQKAVAEKKLAEIEAKKAEEDAKKKAEEESKLAEAELKEKAEQEEKWARLQKIEEEKKRSWDEKNLQEKVQESKTYVRKSEAEQKLAEQEKTQVLIKAQDGTEEKDSEVKEKPLEVSDMKTSKVIKTRSDSAGKRQKVAELVKEANTSGQEASEDFIFDRDHQIENKEDLFAAIGNTSRAAGKLENKKRGTAGVSKDEIQNASKLVPETSVDVKAEGTFARDVLQEGKKSRTSSRERPKDLAIAGTFGDDPSVAAKKTVKSRTASKERLSKVESSQERPCSSPVPASNTPSEEPLRYEDKSKKAKSRTTSRERPVSTQGYRDEFTNRPESELSTGNEERAFKQLVTDSKPTRSRTSSDAKQSKTDRPQSRHGDDMKQEAAEEKIMQQYTSRSKFAASRTPSSEDENILPRLAYTGRQQKSRTSSGERPNSRQQNLQGLQNVVDTERVERPQSSASIGGSSKAKSHTVSRERPNVPKGAQTSKVDLQKRRSRTSSKDSQAQEIEREELFEPQDVDYETMEKDHHPRRFRDEAALDFEEQESSRAVGRPFYSNGKLDSRGIEHLDDNYDIEADLPTEDEDGEPPPTETIFEYSNTQNTNNLPTYELRSGQNEKYDDTDFDISRQVEFNGYIADAEQYASEIEHSEDELGNRVTRTKKVSFAAENEQFSVKPEPEVKVIPGTNMFCFAPSSTHEQPTELVDGGNVTKNKNISKTAPGDKDIPSEQQTQDQEESDKKELIAAVQSSSPKAFLKQMAGIGGGRIMSRDTSKASSGGERRERSNSILDTILRRGSRSRSQGSQGSSRQESMERGGSETGAPYMVTDSYKTVDSSIAEGEQNIATVATTSDPGTPTFFKRIGKKKKPEVKATDFDELFARGHALSAQLEENQPNATATHGVSMNGFSFSPDTIKSASQKSAVLGTQSSSSPFNSQPPTPFAMFSQEEAFKQSQQGAGLSYEEKVQSYLHDQQHTAPFIQQPMDLEYVGSGPDQYKPGSEKEHRSRSRKKLNTQEQPTVQIPPNKAASYANPEDVKIDSMNSEDVMSSASLPTAGDVTSGTTIAVPFFNNMRMRTKDPIGQDVPQTGRSESAASNKRRQMTPEEFLKNLGEFVKKAEVDQQYALPVWPAIVQSPNDLPPTKQSHIPTETYNSLLPAGQPISAHAQRLDSPRPVSPLNKSVITSGQLRPTSPYGVAAELRPSDRSPSPYDPSKPSYPQQQQHQPNIPAIYQQSPSPRPGGSGPGMQRIAPSPGKSYLNQPSPTLSPDPFQSRIEEQTLIDGTGPLPQLPSPSSAIENSSSILADLTMRTAQQHHFSESDKGYDIDATKYGDREVDMQNRRIPSPRMEISQTRIGQVQEEQPILAGDEHIPMQLKPDPLTAHELQNFEQPQQLRIAYPEEASDSKKEQYSQPSIRDTNLYRRLQEGLTNIDKLVQSETFKNEMTRAGEDYRKYSHHLGRAEFGVLKKRSSLGNLSSMDGTHSGFDNPDTAGPTQTSNEIDNLTGFPVQQSASATQLMGRTRFGGGTVGTSDSSRETSKERPGSALAASGFHRTGSGSTSLTDPPRATAATTHIGKRTSRQSSRDSSIGRPDSRLSDNIPDLETEQHPFTGLGEGGVKRTGSSSSRGIGGESRRRPQMMETEDEEQRLQERLDIKPHPEIYEKRQEVLQEMAAQKQTVKEAKVTKKVISGWGDGPEFTYVIDHTGGAFEQQNGTGPPQAPLRLYRGISPRSKKEKMGKSKLPATEIRRIDFERDTPTIKKKQTTTCCRHM